MTAHEFARYLLKCPDLPVVCNGWGSDEGDAREISGVALDKLLGTTVGLYVGYNDWETGKWALADPRIEQEEEAERFEYQLCSMPGCLLPALDQGHGPCVCRIHDPGH